MFYSHEPCLLFSFSCIHIFFCIFLLLNLWSLGFSYMCHSFIDINLSSFFLQGSWNDTRVILLSIFTSLLSILRIDWISFSLFAHCSSIFRMLFLGVNIYVIILPIFIVTSLLSHLFQGSHEAMCTLCFINIMLVCLFITAGAQILHYLTLPDSSCAEGDSPCKL